MRQVDAEVGAKRRTLSQHRAAQVESKSAQDAAVAPPDDKEAQGKVANSARMDAAKPGGFDKAAFIAAVNEAIAAQAPKNLDEADHFAKSGKADRIKGTVDGRVADGRKASAKDIATATTAPPDVSAAKDKPVTPMTADHPPGNPGAPNAAEAVPPRQPPQVLDFSEGARQTDQQMAAADVTEQQLAKGNEPQFNQALAAKKQGEQDSAKAPATGRAAESRHLTDATAHARGEGARALAAMTAARTAAGRHVDSGKGTAKSRDEKRRAEATAKLQQVFDATKKDVEGILSGLDTLVDQQFTAGEKAARDAFMADQARRMKEYKDKRYGGWRGKLRWVKDKFAGLPAEANQLFQDSRALYVSRMQGVISSVADTIGRELGRAKARIATGRSRLTAEVNRLPADLRAYGQQAAQDFAGKFDDLDSDVDDKSKQLVQDLAAKYTQALHGIDEEIKKLQDANKGLWAKAKEAVAGAIKTILELKNLLMGVLAKAASAIAKIIQDPIGFLGHLVTAVGAGLKLFLANIADHLKQGLVSWLLGTAVKAGLDLPSSFDLRGIIQLLASLLGLTWANIRARITSHGVPDQAVTEAEKTIPIAQKLAREGPAGAEKEIVAEAGDLKATILGKLTSYLIPTVIIAGITWILSLLNPASAFVRAVKAIVDIVTFVVTQGAQVIEFVNAVLDAVIAIANGGTAGVPKLVETALAAGIPTLLGLLASLLGIENLAAKVKSVFHAVARPVNRVIDKIVGFIVKMGKKLWAKLKAKFGGKGREEAGQGQDAADPAADDLSLSRSTDMAGEGHTVYVGVQDSRVRVEMASERRQWIGSLIASALRQEGTGRKRSQLLEYLNAMDAQVKEMERAEARGLTQVKKERIEAQLIEITRALNVLGHMFGMKSLTDFTKSQYTANGQLLADYRNGDAIRATFYPGWNKAALDEKQRQLGDHRNRLVTERATWDPNGTHTGSNWYVCPGNGTRGPHLADKSTRIGLPAIDHVREVSTQWNEEGHNTPHPPRETWYNDISNHATICTSCNGSKSGPSFNPDVGPDFRGPGDPP
ncbi:hypothetical protein ITX44_19500 [Streptomyces sp. KK5PA1]|uniref:HNH domain-containing protein n=1 Tax=Actinacidiphila acididurans TaxID=2784346 RepID=A0ABS2TTN4_9ACTN|nr:hypothetical protein [Actinacidiphila acididurans]